MFYMERSCKECKKETVQVFYCDEHIIDACPDECDLVENSAEYSSICIECLAENGYNEVL